jgi:hypothetical protein
MTGRRAASKTNPSRRRRARLLAQHGAPLRAPGRDVGRPSGRVRSPGSRTGSPSACASIAAIATWCAGTRPAGTGSTSAHAPSSGRYGICASSWRPRRARPCAARRPSAALGRPPLSTIRRARKSATGRQLQVDFGEARGSIALDEVRLLLLVATLVHARRPCVRVFRHQRQSAWLEGIEGACRLGGLRGEVLLGNPEPLALHHDAHTREVTFRVRLHALACDWGFRPRAPSGTDREPALSADIGPFGDGAAACWRGWTSAGAATSRATPSAASRTADPTAEQRRPGGRRGPATASRALLGWRRISCVGCARSPMCASTAPPGKRRSRAFTATRRGPCGASTGGRRSARSASWCTRSRATARSRSTTTRRRCPPRPAGGRRRLIGERVDVTVGAGWIIIRHAGGTVADPGVNAGSRSTSALADTARRAAIRGDATVAPASCS